MSLLALHSIQLWLLIAMQAAGDDSACYKDGYSFDCAFLICSRYNMTMWEFKLVLSRIKALYGPKQALEFNLGMQCYADGKLPSVTNCANCISLEHCKTLSSIDICDIFCSPRSFMLAENPLTKMPPDISKLLSTSEASVDQLLNTPVNISFHSVALIPILTVFFCVFFSVFITAEFCIKRQFCKNHRTV